MIDILDGNAINQRIDDLVANKGWTTYELAMRSGLALNTLYNLRNRKSIPSLNILDAVCDALGISVVDFLLDGDELLAPTDEQRELLAAYGNLSPEKKKALLALIKTM